jgi:uncharacterized protein (DUF2062 family)
MVENASKPHQTGQRALRVKDPYMSIAVGMAIGIAVGIVLGVFALHDIMQGIAISIPLGAGIGATLFALGDDL